MVRKKRSVSHLPLLLLGSRNSRKKGKETALKKTDCPDVDNAAMEGTEESPKVKSHTFISVRVCPRRDNQREEGVSKKRVSPREGVKKWKRGLSSIFPCLAARKTKKQMWKTESQDQQTLLGKYEGNRATKKKELQLYHHSNRELRALSRGGETF